MTTLNHTKGDCCEKPLHAGRPTHRHESRTAPRKNGTIIRLCTARQSFVIVWIQENKKVWELYRRHRPLHSKPATWWQSPVVNTRRSVTMGPIRQGFTEPLLGFLHFQFQIRRKLQFWLMERRISDAELWYLEPFVSIYSYLKRIYWGIIDIELLHEKRLKQLSIFKYKFTGDHFWRQTLCLY